MKKNNKKALGPSNKSRQDLPPLITSNKSPKRYKKHSPRDNNGLSQSHDYYIPSMRGNENLRTSTDAGSSEKLRFVSKGLFRDSAGMLAKKENEVDQLSEITRIDSSDTIATTTSESSLDSEGPEHDLPLLVLEANAGNLPEETLARLSLEYDLVITPVTIQELSGISCKSAESEYDALGKDIVSIFKSSDCKALSSTERNHVQVEIMKQLEALGEYVDSVLMNHINRALHRYTAHPKETDMRMGKAMRPRAAQNQSSLFYAEKISKRLPIIKYARLVKNFNGLELEMPISLEDEKLTLKQISAHYPRRDEGILAFVQDRLDRIKRLKRDGIVPTDPYKVRKAQNKVLQEMFNRLRHRSSSGIRSQRQKYQARYDYARDQSDKFQDLLDGYDDIDPQLDLKRKQQLINEKINLHKGKSHWDKEILYLGEKISVCEEFLSRRPIEVRVSDFIRGQVLVGGLKCSSKYDFNDLYQCMATKLLGGSLLSSNTGIQSQVNENPYLSVLLDDFQLVGRHGLDLGRSGYSM
jgi:hypothetical protein